MIRFHVTSVESSGGKVSDFRVDLDERDPLAGISAPDVRLAIGAALETDDGTATVRYGEYLTTATREERPAPFAG